MMCIHSASAMYILVVKMRVSTIKIIRTGLWECIATCVHMVKWFNLSGWLMVQTVSYSNSWICCQYVVKFIDLIYTTKTTKIYTPQNLICLRYWLYSTHQHTHMCTCTTHMYVYVHYTHICGQTHARTHPPTH